MNNTGSRIRELRKDKGLTQDRLGRIMNVDRSTVSRWESGKKIPEEDQIKELCRYFDVDKTYLISAENKEAAIISESKKNDDQTRLMIIFAMIGIVTFLFSPWTLPVGIGSVYFAIRKKMPWFVPVFLSLCSFFCVSQILFLFGIDFPPSIYSVRPR